MSNEKKNAFAALFLLLALFVAAVLLGWGQRGDAEYLDPHDVAWAEWLDTLLVRRQALTAVETSGACEDGDGARFRLRPGERCAVLVKASDIPVREARLELTAGTRVEVTLSQSFSVPEKRFLTAEEPSHKLDVFERGGQLELQCGPTGADCVVFLRP